MCRVERLQSRRRASLLQSLLYPCVDSTDGRMVGRSTTGQVSVVGCSARPLFSMHSLTDVSRLVA